MKLKCQSLVYGRAEGPLLKLAAPLSFWGGVDLKTATICDAFHPNKGGRIGGAILAMPAARGSSSASSALLELVRAGAAPAAILLCQADPILLIGAIVAKDMYGVTIPMALMRQSDWDGLSSAAHAALGPAKPGQPEKQPQLWLDLAPPHPSNPQS
ncbi:MAG: DUF126 domain-containing protein [Pseudomonadota bacterium]